MILMIFIFLKIRI